LWKDRRGKLSKQGGFWQSLLGQFRDAKKQESDEEYIRNVFIIVGLGNPSMKYENTRHNVGFDAIDILADRYAIDVSGRKHRSYIGKGVIEGHKVILAKPQTYMNVSGEAVRSMVDYYKVDVKHKLIVIYDDVSLDLGQIRIREKGSAGGHNGIKSMIQCLGSQAFIRIKMGIGEKPPHYRMSDYVLGHFSKEEREEMLDGFSAALDAVISIMDGEIAKAMNTWNKKKKDS